MWLCSIIILFFIYYSSFIIFLLHILFIMDVWCLKTSSFHINFLLNYYSCLLNSPNISSIAWKYSSSFSAFNNSNKYFWKPSLCSGERGKYFFWALWIHVRNLAAFSSLTTEFYWEIWVSLNLKFWMISSEPCD